MKLKNVDIINAYGACEWLLDREVPAELAFRLADLIGQLQTKQEAFSIAAKRIKKDADGNIDMDEWNSICQIETDINLPKIKRSELIKAFDTIPPKTILALRPLIEEDEDNG